MSTPVHTSGTCVAIENGSGLVGVLLRGASGVGKSDLALRLIDGGARLVADDRVLITARDGRAIASAPQTIRGLMEVRGLGVVEVLAVDDAPLALVVDLAAYGEVPRMPEEVFTEIAEIRLPKLLLNPRESATPAKIRLAIQTLSRPKRPGVTFPFAYG